jgi:hypothetical protein
MLSRVIEVFCPWFGSNRLRLAAGGVMAAGFLGLVLGCGDPETLVPIEDPLNQPPGQASQPQPGHGAAGVALEPILSWSGGGDPDQDAVVYEVFLGTNEPLMSIGTTSDSTLAVGIRLAPDTEFSWRVVTTDGRGASVESETWRFRTTVDANPNVNDPPGPITHPVPADGAADLPSVSELEWQGGADPEGLEVVYSVFFAALPAPLAPIGSTRHLSFDLSEQDLDLHPGATFTWRIEARDPEGLISSSPVWSFTTRANLPPTTPANPEPMDGATGIPVTSGLRWSHSSDPEGDPIVYDVHLGAGADSRQLVASVSDTSYIPPEAFAEGTTYTWQVVARDRTNHSAGPVWYFTTAVPPNFPPTAPQSPSPGHRATDIDPQVILSWDGGMDSDGDSVTFEVYFGISNPPPLAGVQSEQSYDPPGDLPYETTYFWQIVARDDRSAETQGPLWSFTTVEAPNHSPSPPSNFDPPNGATEITHDVVLTWSGGEDPDGDPVIFDVYFGTEDPPSLAQSAASATYDPPGDLEASTSYYWRVVARDGEGGETSSGTLVFTTAP